MNCDDCIEFLMHYLDGELAPEQRQTFEEHLGACPHCSEYLAQIRATIAAVGRVEPESLPSEARDDLVAIYRDWKAG